MKLYILISGFSLFARQFLLPNPFECFGDKALLINLIAEPIIQLLAYVVVGLVYRKGSEPALGSILYLLTYAVIVFILWILSIFKYAWWWILALVLGLSGLIAAVIWIRSKIKPKQYDIDYDKFDL